MRIPRLITAALIPLSLLSTSIAGQAPGVPDGRGLVVGPGGVILGAPMVLTTTAFKDGTTIPVKYTQTGSQTSPALTWTNAPATTMSFVLHLHDIDITRNHTFEDQLHWLVWNIPPTTTSLAEGVPMGADLPDGSHQISPYGPVYRGPGAPAAGPVHHYTFEVFALDVKLDVKASTSGDATANGFETRERVLKAMQGHIVGRAVLMGLFRRPQ